MKKYGIMTIVMAFMFVSAGFAQEEKNKEYYQKEHKENYKKEHKEDCDDHHKKDMAQKEHELISDTSGVFLKQELKEGMVVNELGQIALQKVESEDLRNVILDISNTQVELNQELKEIARDLDVDIPNEPDADQMSEIQRYRDMSGEEFTRDYLSLIVAEQREDIRELENLKEYAVSSDLREWINNNLPKMRDQLQTAQSLQYDFDSNREKDTERNPNDMR